jgi:YYY domain-containing protein
VDSKANWTSVALLAILLVAAGLRLYGLDWDHGQHSHPDERWIAMVAPAITWPERTSDLLNPRVSTLNPLWVPNGRGGGQARNFAYGHLPLYLQSSFGHALASLGDAIDRAGFTESGPPAMIELRHELLTYGDYSRINVAGRALSVLFDLGTVYIAYLLGRRVYGQVVGLLAAALTAVAVMHVQLSHFSTFDVITTFFVTLSVYGSVCIVQARERIVWPSIWAGMAAGLAVASKFSALPLLAALVLAHVLRATRIARAAGPEGHLSVGLLLRRSTAGMLLSLISALVAFAVTSPFAILDARLYLKQILEQGSMVRGQADWPFTRQYRNTTPFLYQIVQQVRWGLGWPLGVAAFAGFLWVTVRQFRRARAEELVMLGWAIPYFLLTGSFMVKFMRYMLPLLPLFITMGAALLWELGQWGNRQIGKWASGLPLRTTALRAFGAVLSALPYLVLVATALYALAFARVYAQTHPWIQASRWIYENVPDGSAIAREHWDDDLPIGLPEPQANPGAHGYDMRPELKLPMYEPDSYAKYDLVRSILRRADYLVLATNRLYRTIPRLPERYPISTEFYRLLFAGRLGYERQVEFTAYPGWFGIEIIDDDADESFTVYDHPKPIVFRKVRDLDDTEWDALFAQVLATPPSWEPVAKGGLLALLDRGPQVDVEPERTLLLDRPVDALPVVADFWWNDWASESTALAVLLWWLVVAALGWVAWPLTFVVFRGLRDRGYLLSRSIGLLVVGYLIWLPSSLHWLPDSLRPRNGLPLTYIAIGILALISSLLLWRYLGEIRAFLQRRRGVVLLGEAVFGLAFLAFVGIRILNPDLWQPWLGGEKSMDIAYLNAVLRSAWFPPYDPYYAHGYLNYYYYGQFLMSIYTRLTGIQSSVAFNLAVPLLFALTVCNAFSIGYSLAGKLRIGPVRRATVTSGIGHGLLTALFVTVVGNLASATQVIENLGRLSHTTFTSRLPGLESLVRAVSGAGELLFHGAALPSFDYWAPSRVVGFTINEFPYWSFLFADLHPHMMNIPFTVLVLAIALNWLLRVPAPAETRLPPRNAVPTGEGALVRSSARTLLQRLDWGQVLNWAIWPLALGALVPINTWDWPAYAGFSGLVLLFGFTRNRGKPGIIPALLSATVLAGSSLLLYAPFLQFYTPIFVGFGWSLGRTSTALNEFMTVWGFVLFLAATLLLILLMRQRTRWGILRLVRMCLRYLPRLPRLDELHSALVRKARPAYRLSIWGILLLVLVTIVFAWRGYWVLVVTVPTLALTAALLLQPKMPDGRRYILGLIFAALLLLVGIEFFYLKDHLDGDQQGWWRMNTVFKFYLQVWVMLGVALGASLPGILRTVGGWQLAGRWTWTGVFVVLLVASLLFPLLGTPARVLDRFPGERPAIGTLDGMAFMTVGTFSWPDENHPIPLWGDYQAIRWLQEHVPGTPVQAEAPVGYYREFGVRAASYSGLPTLSGMHQSEQRYPSQVGVRSARAHDLYATVNLGRTMDLIDQMQVSYVYLGPLENIQYPSAKDKFDGLVTGGLLTVAYSNDLVTIYRVANADS